MNPSKLIAITIIVTIAIVIVVKANGNNNLQSQELRTLESRVQMLEQRIYSIEANLSRLQTAPQRSASTSEVEVNLMHQHIQNLTSRISDVECGLLKLDQRTITSRIASQPKDPCRLNPTQPIQLPLHP